MIDIGDVEDLTDQSPQEFLGYAMLCEQNPHMAGWVKIDGTKLDYPVMFTPDEPEYYIHRAFDGSYAVIGVPFVGKGCTLEPPSDNIILYGHNMKTGTMFSTLSSYAKKKDQLNKIN